jgi:predicted nucleic acid-binding protein
LIEKEEVIVSPDIMLYEVVNTLWKQQFLFKRIKDGAGYISVLFDLIDSGSIVLFRPDLRLMNRAYNIAGKQRIALYDAVFLALALETDLELKSLDKNMINLFDRICQPRNFRSGRKGIG